MNCEGVGPERVLLLYPCVCTYVHIRYAVDTTRVVIHVTVRIREKVNGRAFRSYTIFYGAIVYIYILMRSLEKKPPIGWLTSLTCGIENHKYNFRLTPFIKSPLFPPLKNFKFLLYRHSIYLYLDFRNLIIILYPYEREHHNINFNYLHLLFNFLIY